MAKTMASLDGHLRQIFGGEQCWLGFSLQFGFDVLAEIAETMEFVLIHGNADVAYDALADLAVFTVTLDELDGLAGAVGRGLDANEHELPFPLGLEPG